MDEKSASHQVHGKALLKKSIPEEPELTKYLCLMLQIRGSLESVFLFVGISRQIEKRLRVLCVSVVRILFRAAMAEGQSLPYGPNASGLHPWIVGFAPSSNSTTLRFTENGFR